MQGLIVIVIVAAAAIYLGRKLFKRGHSHGEAGCDKCDH